MNKKCKLAAREEFNLGRKASRVCLKIHRSYFCSSGYWIARPCKCHTQKESFSCSHFGDECSQSFRNGDQTKKCRKIFVISLLPLPLFLKDAWDVCPFAPITILSPLSVPTNSLMLPTLFWDTLFWDTFFWDPAFIIFFGDPTVIIVDNSDINDNYDNYWQLLTIVDNCWQQQQHRTFDFWGTDCNSDNWEPEFMTFFVTNQLKVTLDSICNSCHVCLLHMSVHCVVKWNRKF